jgi:hypothetical protein
MAAELPISDALESQSERMYHPALIRPCSCQHPGRLTILVGRAGNAAPAADVAAFVPTFGDQANGEAGQVAVRDLPPARNELVELGVGRFRSGRAQKQLLCPRGTKFD